MSKPARLWRYLKPRIGPAFLIVVGVTMLVWVVLRADSERPPSAQEYGLVVAFSAALHIAGGYGMSRIGRAHPSLARSAVRRLGALGRSMALARAELQGGDPGAADAFLESATDALTDAVADWHEVHPEALREVVESEKESNVKD